jgi:hypothetical protein
MSLFVALIIFGVLAGASIAGMPLNLHKVLPKGMEPRAA